ncbi:MAG TPA: signal peptide peptidase SppA [Treponemataceae bacterium]|nr:signal peptide peptidase SppA [Treponemataceae bacterium]
MDTTLTTENKSLVKQKKPKGLIVLLAIIVIGIIFSLFSIMTTKSSDTGFLTPWSKFTRGNYIAILRIEGTIASKSEYYDQEWLLNTVRDLAEDEKNLGIVLDINSPGGAVFETDEVYLALMDYKNQTNKPIVAYFEQIVASGGYYIACAADYIWSNRNTLTGSIGVVSGQSFDLSRFFEKHGIQYSIFTAGKNKDMLGIASPVTDEHRIIMEDIANECYLQFCTIVSNSRNLSLEQTKVLADGRIYTATQAKKNGLIDTIGSLNSAKNWIIDLLGTEREKSRFIWFKPKKETTVFSRLLNSAMYKSMADNKIENSLTTLNVLGLPGNLSFPAYYWTKF